MPASPYFSRPRRRTVRPSDATYIDRSVDSSSFWNRVREPDSFSENSVECDDSMLVIRHDDDKYYDKDFYEEQRPPHYGE